MTPERLKRLSELFAAALEQEAGLRPEFVREECAGDEELEADLDRLLIADERPGGVPDSTTKTEPGRIGELNPYSGILLKGRYRVIRMLGGGGFGIVYLAHDTQLYDRSVVFKVLREQVDREWFLRKFEEECRALARIRRPGVVGVLDQGHTPDGAPFLVMEYVDGITLQSAMTGGGLDLSRTRRLIRQIGEALGAATITGFVTAI